MKKFKLETKYLMIALVVVIGLLLAVSGTFQESKSMTAYKTDATGSDSARVAKWNWTYNGGDLANTAEPLTFDLFNKCNTNEKQYF